MKTRKQIEESIEEKGATRLLVVQLLLDIRELLSNKKK